MSRTRAITKAMSKKMPSRAEFDTHVGGARLAIGRAEALTDALHPGVAHKRVERRAVECGEIPLRCWHDP